MPSSTDIDELRIAKGHAGGGLARLPRYFRSGRILPSNYARCDTPRWFKVGDSVTYAKIATDAKLNGATHTYSFGLFQLAPGGVIHAMKLKHSAPFAGGGICAYALSLGVSGSLEKYVDAFDVHQEPHGRAYQLSVTCAEDHDFTTSILLTARSAGAFLVAATQGAVDIWALLSMAA